MHDPLGQNICLHIRVEYLGAISESRISPYIITWCRGGVILATLPDLDGAIFLHSCSAVGGIFLSFSRQSVHRLRRWIKDWTVPFSTTSRLQCNANITCTSPRSCISCRKINKLHTFPCELWCQKQHKQVSQLFKCHCHKYLHKLAQYDAKICTDSTCIYGRSS